MKKLISFLAVAAIVGVIGCDSSSTWKPFMVNDDVMKQWMDPGQWQHYLPEKSTPADTTGS